MHVTFVFQLLERGINHFFKLSFNILSKLWLTLLSVIACFMLLFFCWLLAYYHNCFSFFLFFSSKNSKKHARTRKKGKNGNEMDLKWCSKALIKFLAIATEQLANDTGRLPWKLTAMLHSTDLRIHLFLHLIFWYSF